MEMSVSGRGVSRESRPVLPSSGEVGKPQSVEEAQHLSRSISTAKSAEAIKDLAPTQPVEKPPEAAKFETISEKLKLDNVKDHLMRLGLDPSTKNASFITEILKHGLAANLENFDEVARLMKRQGKTGDPQASTRSLESAVVSLAKGLAGSPRGVEVLSAYLMNTPEISKQIQKLQQHLSLFRALVLSNQGLFDPGLFAGLVAIIGDLDDSLKKLMRRAPEKGVHLPKFNRGETIENFRLFQGFLGGLVEKLTKGGKLDGGEGMALKEVIKGLRQQSNSFLDLLVSQAILSKDSKHQQAGFNDRYFYWQMPNPLSKDLSNLDLLIKKNEKSKKIDPENARMFLKFDTPDIGEIVIMIDLKSDKVWYTFQTDNADTKVNIEKLSVDLKERMATINYTLAGFKTLKKRVQIKKVLLPTYDLDKMTMVRAEV